MDWNWGIIVFLVVCVAIPLYVVLLSACAYLGKTVAISVLFARHYHHEEGTRE